jgi:hypothetical protein
VTPSDAIINLWLLVVPVSGCRPVQAFARECVAEVVDGWALASRARPLRSRRRGAFRSRHGHGSEGRSCRLSAGAGRVAGVVTERVAQSPPAASTSAIRLARANLEITATRGDETQGRSCARAYAGDEDQVDKHEHQLLGVPRTRHVRRNLQSSMGT